MRSPVMVASRSSSCTVYCLYGTTSSMLCSTSSPLSTLIDTVRSMICVTGSKLSNSAPHSTKIFLFLPWGTSHTSLPPSPMMYVPSNRSPGWPSSSSSRPPGRRWRTAQRRQAAAALLSSMWEKVPSRHMTMSKGAPLISKLVISPATNSGTGKPDWSCCGSGAGFCWLDAPKPTACLAFLPAAAPPALPEARSRAKASISGHLSSPTARGTPALASPVTCSPGPHPSSRTEVSSEPSV
mmetsp:Transcript_6309/g.13893  ORF Transcript_6309/g.13893 Transcript_6309/m.13893 type:complete len:239 (+) Transcript_6309:729-1445(+)